MIVYNLTCEDASHLGGPMGTEYTEFMWTKPFSSLEKAKAYAKKYHKFPFWAEWQEDENGDRWYIDVGAYGFKIEKQEIS